VSSRPYLIYTGIETWLASAVAVASTTAVVYRVESGHLNALELILVGTAVELVYFVFQLPTGILADLVSRRLCVIAGVFLTAAGFLAQWASASFAVFVLAQVPIGVGAALIIGAQEAWLADESGSSELTSAFLRAGQWSLGGTLVGSVLGGLLARAGLSLPYLVGGVVTGLLGVVLVLVMPENNFRPSAWHRACGGRASTGCGVPTCWRTSGSRTCSG
jgi:MFS transporter, DHA3 family, tetracycline resistance protein